MPGQRAVGLWLSADPVGPGAAASSLIPASTLPALPSVLATLWAKCEGLTGVLVGEPLGELPGATSQSSHTPDTSALLSDTYKGLEP